MTKTPLKLLIGFFLFSCSQDSSDETAIEAPFACFEYSSPFIDTIPGIFVAEYVQFSNCSDDAISYLWDFGDGNTSVDQNPEHQFTEEGTFTVVLEAIGEVETTTVSQQITIVGEVSGNVGEFETSEPGLTSSQFNNGFLKSLENNKYTLVLYGGGLQLDTDCQVLCDLNNSTPCEICMETESFSNICLSGQGDFLVVGDVWGKDVNDITGIYQGSSFVPDNPSNIVTGCGALENNRTIGSFDENDFFWNIGGVGIEMRIGKFNDTFVIEGCFNCSIEELNTFKYRGELELL